mmetsp:Transcript_19254/g.27444  ORF Transcript_19254/g.27444 Transcript_19254/m.27444 type:complete len:293 (-) Transcript_19254:91-969(-)|eukprot:CAMPEP_0172422802 /NCGR_PEP_ID=MMETSP1064-20121228/8927_1 /TAXON_ID=202472 /ORGANISM="Aulacoseira subarctica , Strain CCAP 1002/5" /LENGTH=292 /DNA_ID=CAMNT_0013163845 /DNA_START=69 /DNA_END=947 /DNA_ORIENTATION=+
MSFQDVGRGRGRGNAAAGKREKSSLVATTTTSTGALGVCHISPKKTLVGDLSSASTTTAAIVVGSRTNIFGSVSDTILQYQRNVAILNNIAKSFLSTTNSEEEIRILSQQYEVQRDVITQLGSKIERQLREAEAEMSASSSLTTSEATQARNAHIKLTRDYRAVELVYKNLVLNVKQRKHFVESQKQLRMQQEQQVVEEQQSRQQMMLQVQRDEEQINLQIMREREEEIRKINQGMRTVNEIYKDLSNIVSEQQEDIDKVEMHMEQSNMNAKQGLEQLEKANANADRQCVIS